MVLSNPLLRLYLSRESIPCLQDIVHHCSACSSREGLELVVECLKVFVPFEFFTCVYAHIDGGRMVEPFHVVNVNYPQEWMDIYLERKYHLIDPIIKQNFSSFNLQYWADTYQCSPPDKEFLSTAEEFGLRSGYTSGIRNLAGNRGGLFSFAGMELEKHEFFGAIIEVITPHLYQALERIVCTDRQKKVPALSVREREVLKWVALGKTTWETSVIMNIGERTVKFHVYNLMKKLNAVTRTHAVALASDLGLVDLD